jgi:uncharacterized RDD family membrane protein YckC
MTDLVAEPQPTLRIAGFWRRLVAFAVDAFLLGIVGSALGWSMYGPMARLGGYARLLGFAIALAYFGVLNSRIGGGQTLGKRLLGIRVTRVNGGLMSLPRSMLRYSVLGIPFFLNYAPIPPQVALSPVGYLISLLLFGGMFSIIYLYIFNRRTRRSLHDFVAGTWVLRDDPGAGAPALVPVWPGHLVVVGVLLAISLVAPAVAGHLVKQQPFGELLSTYKAVSGQPGVQRAMVASGSTKDFGGGQSTNIDWVAAQVFLDGPNTADAEMAKRTARLILSTHPDAATKSIISVQLIYAFDMGIASGWRAQKYQYKPEELK